ncbi:beta-propeller fold lactonase family protein [Leptospira sp. 96542]|nr:beta-propeller fold lactonase family protein [Leptospira sp. 96542]
MVAVQKQIGYFLYKCLFSGIIVLTTSSCILNPFIQDLIWPSKKNQNLHPFLGLFVSNSRTITIDPNFLGLQKESAGQLTAILFDSGNPIESGFQWTSANPSIATVDNNGLVTAVSNGKTNIIATASGAFGTCTVTVYSGIVYATLDGANQVTRSTMNSTTGFLTYNDFFPTGAAPTGIVVDPFGRYLYTGNFDDDTISQFAVNPANGNLTVNGTASAQYQPRNLAISNDGRFLYAAKESGGIGHYLINGDGTLSFQNSFNVSASSSQVIIDPTGKFLLALAPSGNQLTSFSIDPNTGFLTLLSISPTFDSSGLMAIHPGGKFVYIGSSPNITILNLDSQSGLLTISGGQASAGNFNGGTVHPSGKFLYFVNLSTGFIYGFSIDQNSGLITPLTPISTLLTDIRFLVIEPSGRFAYLANKTTNEIYQFSINQSTGDLTFLNGTNVGGTQWNLFFM